MTAAEIIDFLKLSPLPMEGGYFRETYRSNLNIRPGQRNSVERSIATAIYYLLTPTSSSAFHKLKSDEIFHFYLGDSVEMIQIDPAGQLEHFYLGSDIFAAEQPQCLVSAGTWQASFLREGGSFALLGTTVSPGFDFQDFQLGEESLLQKEFPQHSEVIKKIFSSGGI
ncbi:hypothetical protein BVY02_02040 [bacterium J17]|nr:hypothetical protein BVY02_02040 [bacterium J17]